MLSRGFTTIRDVGGANKHYKEATADWLIPGPRVFQGGPVMSQTGGHGESALDRSTIVLKLESQVTPLRILMARFRAVPSPRSMVQARLASWQMDVSFFSISQCEDCTDI